MNIGLFQILQPLQRKGNGKWTGLKLWDAITKKNPNIQLIAEDLGIMMKK